MPEILQTEVPSTQVEEKLSLELMKELNAKNIKTISLLKTTSHLLDISFGGVINIIILALIRMTIKTRGKINIAETPVIIKVPDQNEVEELTPQMFG